MTPEHRSEGLNELARFAASADCDRLPVEIVDKAAACLLYAMAVAVASMRAVAPRQAALALPACGNGATRYHDGKGSDPGVAAFANATLFHARVQDDAHPAGHVGVVVVPAALAMAEAHRATGAQLLAALVAGYETALRIGRDHTTDSSARGFRTTPIYGVFGAAAAASRLLGLDASRTAHALALAANMAGGLREFAESGSEDFAFQAGSAAQAGLTAARLAASGATSSATALTGKAGFFRAYGEARTHESAGRYSARLAASLGEDYEMLGVTFKPYPICQFHRGVVRGSAALSRLAGGAALEALEVRMHPFEADFFGVRYAGPFGSFPQTFMSAPFCASLGWSTGTATYAGLTDFRARGVLELVPRIAVVADPGRARYGPRLVARLADGTTLDWEERELAAAYLLTWDAARRMAMELGAEAGVERPAIELLIGLVADVRQAATLEPLCAAMAQACRSAAAA